jgi:hypothetical protein
MMVLSELRHNYWAAEVAHSLFKQAEAMLHTRAEHHRMKSIVSGDSTSDNLRNQFTSLPPLIPDSTSLDTSQLRSPETQQTLSDDYLFDPGNISLEQFPLGSMFDTDAYVGFDAATMLETYDLGT